MQYKCLIEKTKDFSFRKEILPHLNHEEEYYKVYLLTEDGTAREMLVGFAYRCSIIDLYEDLKNWAEEEVDGVADFQILTKKYVTIDSFGNQICKVIDSEIF